MAKKLANVGSLFCSLLFWTIVADLHQASASKSPRLPMNSEDRAKAKSAKPILDAVFLFKHQTGLWPYTLDELPEAVAKNVTFDWRFKNDLQGNWTLTNVSNFPNSIIQYRHLKTGSRKWLFSVGEDYMPFDVPYIPPSYEKVDEQDLKSRMLEILSNRVKRHPEEIVHRKVIFSFLVEKGLHAKAMEYCLDSLRRWPEHWWCNIGYAVTRAQNGDTDAAEKQLIEWVDRHKDFFHYYLLAHFYSVAGQHEKCYKSLRQATEHPIVDLNGSVDSEAGEKLLLGSSTYLRYAAILAYSYGQLDLCLTICDSWEAHLKNRRGDTGFGVFRAACLLNQGKSQDALSSTALT